MAIQVGSLLRDCTLPVSIESYYIQRLLLLLNKHNPWDLAVIGRGDTESVNLGPTNLYDKLL
jgi:hypothetical protein